MEKVACGQAGAVRKKGKKKQAKDELDRLKQAEKKRRRLEKALATSAAIRSELEKKKQKKKEEQQRLDEEGAAVAEAVALHVLGEDTDDSCHFMLNNHMRYNPEDKPNNFDLLMGYQSFTKYSVEGLGWATYAYGPGWKWNDRVLEQSMPSGMHAEYLQAPYYEVTDHRTDISAEHVAAQAVSSLRIAENPPDDQFAGQGVATVVINKMLGGNSMGNKVNFYKEL